jgi:hypothetical protein
MQTQPVEDIDSVLGRFQAWAGSRNAVEAQAGIRELSSEEALRSSRYRWKVAVKTPARKKLGSGPGVTPVTSPVAASEAEAKRDKAVTGKHRDAKVRVVKQVHAKNHAVKASPAKGTVVAKRRHSLKTVASAKAQAKSSFREALAEKVRPTEVIVAAQPVGLARQVAISIRLAPAERALIKTRAAEAGISASAYIRQCTLEVEQLRAQVQQALAAIERKTPLPVQPPATTHGPTLGFFARLMQKIFPARGAALAVRA